jgi:tape measure domain-containing protein
VADNRYELDLVVNASKAISETAKFTKAQEQSVDRIKAAQEEQVRSNAKVDRAIIETRAQYSKKRAELVRYSKNLKKNQADADRTAKELLELSSTLEKQKQKLREGRRAIIEYSKQLDKLQRQASKGINLETRSQNVIPAPPRMLGPGVPEAVGRRAAFQRGAKNAGARLNAASAAVGSSGLLGGLATGAFLQQTVSASVDLSSQRKKLELLSKQYGEYDQVLKIVKTSADTFNKSQREATTEFANVFARLRPLGVSLNEIKGVYEGFNTVAIASGATSEASRIAFMQLSQAIGSGRLAGDEFRSVSEQIPGVLIPIAKEMGVTVGELKQLGSEGKITSDVLINALSGSLGMTTEEIKKFVKEQPAGKFKAFSNAVSDLAVVIGDALMPVALAIVETLTGLIEIFLRLPGPFKTITGLVTGLGAAFFTANAAAAALNITLNTKLAVTLGALAGKIALVLAPLVALGLVLEDNKKRKESFDEAMASDDVDVVDGKIEEITTNVQNMEQALKSIEGAGYYKGQASDAESIKKQLKEAREQLEKLEGRRKLFIDVEFGIKDFDGDKAVITTDFKQRLADELKKLGLKQNKGKPVSEIKPTGTGGLTEAQRIEKVNANNALRLAQKKAQISMKVARDEYALRAELEQSNHRLQEGNLIGLARQQQAILNARIEAIRQLEQRQQQLTDSVEGAQQKLDAAILRRDQAVGNVDRARAEGGVSLAQAELTGAKKNLSNFQASTPTMLSNIQENVAQQSTEGFRQQTQQTLIQVAALRKRNELLAQGVSPEVLQGELAKLEIDRQAGVQLKQLNADTVLNADAISQVKTEAENAKNAIDQLTAAQEEGTNKIRDYINTSMEFVSDIQGRILDIASTIEQSIGTAIQGVVDGTLTASQAFGQFFQNVGKAFLQMAAQIIAKLIVINLLKAALGFMGGSGFGGMPGGVGLGDGGGTIQNAFGSKFGTFGPNFGIPQLAKGGIVTGPTTALIGEGGMNEAVVPLPNGKAIPVDMRGAAGGNVTSNVTVNVATNGETSSSSGDGAAKLGRAIDTAVRKVIMDERRSGGLLYSGR